MTIAVLLIALLSCAKQATAQEGGHFIEVLSETSLSLTDAQQTTVDALTAIPEVESYYFAEIGNLMDFQDSGRIAITYSNQPERSYWTLPTRVDFQDDWHYTWMGRTLDRQYNVVLHRTEDGCSGWIHEMGAAFKFTRIVALSSTLSLCLEFDLTEPLNFEHPTSLEGEVNLPSTDCDGDCSGNLHILFLLTSDAQDYIISGGGTQRLLDDMVNELRFTWTNSQINHSVSYDWDSFDWTRYSTGNCEEDADSLSTNPAIGNLRDAYGADVVILVPGPSVVWDDALACVAEIGPVEDKAFVVLPIHQGIMPGYVFSHEIGHLYGAQHTPGSSSDRGRCAFANIFRAGGKFNSTVMAARNANDRIPYFSNPEVPYQGVPTGRYATSRIIGAMNAQAIQANGCTLADFRDNAQINAFFDIERNQPGCWLELAADVQPANANYTYEWYWSFDGLFSTAYPGQYLGAGPTPTFSDPALTYCKRYFVQLVVKRNGLVVAKTSKRTLGGICPSDVLNCYAQPTASSKTIQIPNKDFRNDQFSVEQINVYDINGTLIKTISDESDFSVPSIIYGEKLPPGMYFIQRQAGAEGVRVDKIIVL
ncbi:MAG: zinc-dependent metalloprotease [Bacteroidota bacterium]